MPLHCLVQSSRNLKFRLCTIIIRTLITMNQKHLCRQCLGVACELAKVAKAICCCNNSSAMMSMTKLAEVAFLLPYFPAITPPPLFATYFQEKEGGGGSNEDLCFWLAVKPPPTNSHTEINEALLCGRRRELLRSTCRGSTEGWKSC